MRILAVDWGERRIGLAVSDPTGLIASPIETLVVEGREPGVARVAALAHEHEAERIVVGLPLRMSGERGEAGKETRAGYFNNVHGIAVDPKEWWDPLWIKKRIEPKLATWRNGGPVESLANASATPP